MKGENSKSEIRNPKQILISSLFRVSNFVLRIFYFLFLVSCFLLPTSGLSSEFTPKGPLTLRNQNPIYLEFLNLQPGRAVAISKGVYEIRIDNAYSNIYEEGYGPNNSLLLDMELLRTALCFNAGIYDGMEAGIEIPFLRLDSGFLDGFIQKYHNIFGLPNSGREHVPNNSFTYRFSENGAPIYQIGEQAFNLGDVTLDFKHNFINEGRLVPAVAWQFYFKIPTGARSKGLGSGDPDFGFTALLEKSHKRWHGYLNLGYFVNGGHKQLEKYINDVYFTFVLGGELSVSRPVSVVAQVTGGTPLLKGADFIQWDSFPMDLQLGVKGEHPLKGAKRRITWQAAFTEDINPDGPSIDFTVLGSIGYKFGAHSW